MFFRLESMDNNTINSLIYCTLLLRILIRTEEHDFFDDAIWKQRVFMFAKQHLYYLLYCEHN